jgi:hypothetical protein
MSMPTNTNTNTNTNANTNANANTNTAIWHWASEKRTQQPVKPTKAATRQTTQSINQAASQSPAS